MGYGLPCVLVSWEPVPQHCCGGGLQGAGSPYATFGTEGSFLRGPKLHFLHKEFPSWKSLQLCRYLPYLPLFSFNDVSMEIPQANN